ncbi:four helix bundle protein [uncultured Pedobacter sp.]|uniref:four helix bundle protein n=1 Tax=uncultured Pedobacter sp. TaxID=246139 RepID=UPI0025D35008|nr:four helix bundle protein [uncultured Pedobacter sp.]
MAKVEKFEDLEIWQLAKEVGVEAYRISDLEPMKSDFGLKDQFRRAAMSDNVAEGFEYNNNPDFIRFLVYAKGSSGEFRNKLIVLEEAKKLSIDDFNFFMPNALNFLPKQKDLSIT